MPSGSNNSNVLDVCKLMHIESFLGRHGTTIDLKKLATKVHKDTELGAGDFNLLVTASV